MFVCFFFVFFLHEELEKDILETSHLLRGLNTLHRFSTFLQKEITSLTPCLFLFINSLLEMGSTLKGKNSPQ